MSSRELAVSQVIVVGAGIAGLVAIHTLKSSGVDAVVLESSDRPGGRMISDVAHGHVIDGGTQFFSSGYPVILELLKEVGLHSQLHPTSPWSAVVRGGKPRKLRGDVPVTVWRSGLLGWRSCLQLGQNALRSWHALISSPLNDYSRWSGFDDCTVSEAAAAGIASEVVEYLHEPVLQGFYFQDPETTSHALAQVLAGFSARRTQALALQDGMEALPRALAQNLSLASRETVLAGRARNASGPVSGSMPPAQAGRTACWRLHEHAVYRGRRGIGHVGGEAGNVSFAQSPGAADVQPLRRRAPVDAGVGRRPGESMAIELFYSPGSCSMAVHIVLNEIGVPFELHKFATAERANYSDEYLAINPKARIPALKIDGYVLTENPAILAFLGRRFPDAKLYPATAGEAEARCLELLAWSSNTVHVAYAQIFRPERFVADEQGFPAVKQSGHVNYERCLVAIEEKLRHQEYALGDRFSVVDPFWLIFFRWGARAKFGMRDDFPAFTAYAERLCRRPSVQKALDVEAVSIWS